MTAATPTRTCVGCRRTDRQDALVRVVRAERGVAVDLRRRLPGRGAWLHRDLACWPGARGGLSRALRTSVTDRDLASVRATLINDSAPTDPAHDLRGPTASDSGLLRRDAVDNATRSKAQE